MRRVVFSSDPMEITGTAQVHALATRRKVRVAVAGSNSSPKTTAGLSRKFLSAGNFRPRTKFSGKSDPGGTKFSGKFGPTLKILVLRCIPTRNDFTAAWSITS